MKKKEICFRKKLFWTCIEERKGMELVQVGILIAIAIGIGLIFKTQITAFVNGTFDNLMNSGF